jgi:ferredoxin-NADP reductase
MTPNIRAYELHADVPDTLPPATPGAHIDLPVRLADGTIVTRQYSLVLDPEQPQRYEIAVLREDKGRGGSRSIHDHWHLGTTLHASAPVNHFPVHMDRRPAVLIAGGIGITPILSMARMLKHRRVPFELHYSGRTPTDMAYREEIAQNMPTDAHLYFTRTTAHHRLDADAVLQGAADDALVYVCGPRRLIDAVSTVAKRLGIAAERIRYESFD